MTDIIRLLKNLLVLLIIGGLGYLVYYFFFQDTPDDVLKIDDTPTHVETIRVIAEIGTVNYKDEVVIDKVIRYKGSSTWDWLNMQKKYDEYLNSNIKRRLTVIVKGEVRYGVDLTDSNYSIRQTKDSLFVQFPNPKILDVIVSPSKTEIFQEQGKWSDSERKALEVRAKSKLVLNSKAMDLISKTEKNLRKLMNQMIQTDKKVIVTFDK